MHWFAPHKHEQARSYQYLSVSYLDITRHKRKLTWRTVHQTSLRWGDTKRLEFVRLLHWQNTAVSSDKCRLHSSLHGLNELLNLLVQTTNVRVCLCRSLIDFHSFDTGIVF